MKSSCRVAAVGDVHRSLEDDQSLAPLFAEMARVVDIIALCGDLTNLGLPEEAEKFASDMRGITAPIVGVLGNHDHESDQAEEVRRILRAGGFHFLDEKPFVHQGVGFAGVRGFGGGFGRYEIPLFGEPESKAYARVSVGEALKLEAQLQELGTEKLVVVLHYSPIAGTLGKEPEQIYPFLGSSRLMDVIDKFPVSVVFHGHAHHGSLTGHTEKKIPVYNVARELLERESKESFVRVEV